MFFDMSRLWLVFDMLFGITKAARRFQPSSDEAEGLFGPVFIGLLGANVPPLGAARMQRSFQRTVHHQARVTASLSFNAEAVLQRIDPLPICPR